MSSTSLFSTIMSSSSRLKNHPLINILGQYTISIGLFIRIFLAWLLPWLLDSGRLLPGVAYTDIDYLVFTDASKYILDGGSPYDRHTYRYTPFLAQLLSYTISPTNIEVPRYIFCIADTICGVIILYFRQKDRNRTKKIGNEDDNSDKDNDTNNEYLNWNKFIDSLYWLYNPLAINICTRGSAESFMVLLPVLLTVQIVTTSSSSTSTTSTSSSLNLSMKALFAGICHGIAVHSKLYPIIYSLSFMAYFSTKTTTTTTITRNARNNKGSNAKVTTFPWLEPKRLFNLIILWIKRLLVTPASIIFLLSFVTTFVGLTYLAVLWYGDIALQEGLLYHFSRVDHRHNYSMWWYYIYLARAANVAATSSAATNIAATTTTTSTLISLSNIGKLLILPQLVLLVYSSLGIAPYNLSLALFVQTYLFVIHNKVITAQYFTWYLCLLPLCRYAFTLTKRVIVALVLLILSILLWLGSAYCLEMQGITHTHTIVWIMSIIHFIANINMLSSLLSSTRITSEPKTKTTSVKKKQ